jgi:L-cysteine S-thiosulfotransferase
MKIRRLLLCICLVQSASAVEPRTSGNVYLSPQLQALQNDINRNPIALWLDRGQTLWQAQCQSCHGNMEKLKNSVVSFPRLSVDGKTLRNLEDQIAICQQRASKTGASTDSANQTRVAASNENDEVLALSAALHHSAKAEPINVAAPATQENQWQARLANGQKIYQTRMGRINLACMHCHDQKVGAQMRADTISQGHPTGFPIYRMSWQTLGSTERRLRACYSGVQAPIPDPGSADLRDLELFLKVRANAMVLDGPSIRR